MNTTRRAFLQSGLTAVALASTSRLCAATDPIAPYRTRYKYPNLVLKATGNKGDFDAQSHRLSR